MALLSPIIHLYSYPGSPRPVRPSKASITIASGAFLLRRVHGLLVRSAAQGIPVCDDLLCVLRAQAPVALFFCAIAAPINCLTLVRRPTPIPSHHGVVSHLLKKAQFQDALCGVGRLTSPTIPSNLCRPSWSARGTYRGPSGKRKVSWKTLEQRIRLLIWATSIALHVRSWMAPLYADLHSYQAYALHPPQLAGLSKNLYIKI